MRRIKVLFIVFTIVLASCIPLLNLDFEFSLNANEAWDVQIRFKVPAAAAVSLNSNPDLIRQISDPYTAQGLKVEYGKPFNDNQGQVVYPLTVHGKGYDLLNQSLFNGEQVFSKDIAHPGQVIFTCNPGLASMGGYSISQLTVILHAGKIISTNGISTNSSTTTWVNPTEEMNAVLEEKSNLTFLYVIIVLAILGGGAYLLWNKNRKGRAQQNLYLSNSPMQVSRFCMFCGFQLPVNAEFCPKCGNKN